MAYILANNNILKATEANLTPFLLTTPDMHKHSIWFGFGGIPLLDENLDILENEFKQLGHNIPDLFKNRRELFRLIKRMLNKNRFYRTGLITFQFFIAEEKIDYLITCKAFEDFNFQANEQGLLINISDSNLLSFSQNNNSRFAKATFWKLVGAEMNDKANQAAIILNEKQAVCEGISANLFMIKEHVLYTPSLQTGCYSDVIRPEIIRLASKLKMNVVETEVIEVKHLLEMDEIFFASETKGIQWVLGFENRRYVHNYTDQIYSGLNRFLENKVEDQK
ncbi:aminotransferase class IV [Draconibacterium sp. IB214405]|uniref:aminotransferase class IV n=1 Tax=Draconibacterium sp. IB214405 TaxID=3097352 RepID=UPI002A17577D|nr:aminotransferase class IV [Draconibacterium sp. IB214405]MDX8339261.1 aminotransferase class IV [Draconibacterium sp. IB214405]